MTTPTITPAAYARLAAARAALADMLASTGAAHLADLVLQGQHTLNPRECAELDAWLAGRLPDVARSVSPMRRGADSATRAGTLARGQWRGTPVLPRGVSSDAVDAPRVSGYLWAVIEALASSDAAHANRNRRIGRTESRRKRDAARGTCDPWIRKVRAALCRMRDACEDYEAAREAFRAKHGI